MVQDSNLSKFKAEVQSSQVLLMACLEVLRGRRVEGSRGEESSGEESRGE